MKLLTNYSVRVLATGFVVLTLLSIPLFWLRFMCRMSLAVRIPEAGRTVSIEPSGYISPEIDEDPNLTQRSRVTAKMNPEMFPASLGITYYFASRSPMGSNSNVFVDKSRENWMYFDEKSGQIVCRYTDTETMPDRNTLRRQVQYHVGPEGISEISDEGLGRFIEPIISQSWVTWGHDRARPADLILYDRKLRQFFKIDFDRPTVVKGPALGDDASHDPVRMGLLSKNPSYMHLDFSPPRKEAAGYHYYTGQYGRQSGAVIQSGQHHSAGPHLLVLDKSGRIDLLDKETLQFVGIAGRLPRPATLCGHEKSATPDSMLSYQVKPLYLGDPIDPNEAEGRSGQTRDPNSLRYAGMFAASMSRNGTAVAITTFDDKGQTKEQIPNKRQHDNSAEMAYYGTPLAPLSTVVMYITESLHPPILSVASCFTASAFEAGAGHRALFLLPNSLIAMNARDNRDPIGVKFVAALLLISPAVILAAWLACRVARDAKTVGLPRNLRRFWALLTLAFGLAGYITYRLTRPTMTLVTCANCGKPRRPDTETCHHCKSKWQVPELIPPTWRVLAS